MAIKVDYKLGVINYTNRNLEKLIDPNQEGYWELIMGRYPTMAGVANVVYKEKLANRIVHDNRVTHKTNKKSSIKFTLNQNDLRRHKQLVAFLRDCNVLPKNRDHKYFDQEFKLVNEDVILSPLKLSSIMCLYSGYIAEDD